MEAQEFIKLMTRLTNLSKSIDNLTKAVNGMASKKIEKDEDDLISEELAKESNAITSQLNEQRGGESTVWCPKCVSNVKLNNLGYCSKCSTDIKSLKAFEEFKKGSKL